VSDAVTFLQSTGREKVDTYGNYRYGMSFRYSYYNYDLMFIRVFNTVCAI